MKCPFDNKTFDHVNVDMLGRNFTLLDLIDADRPGKLSPDERFCTQHPKKKVKFFCKEHTVFVCSECLLTNHIGHEVVAAKPLILGEAVNLVVSQTGQDLSKLKDLASAHLQSILAKHRTSKVQIESVA